LGLAGQQDLGPSEIDAFGEAIFGAPIPGVFRHAIERGDGLARKTIFEAARSGVGIDQRGLVEKLAAPLAVVNGSQDPFINLDYLEVPKYANLWEGRWRALRHTRGGGGHERCQFGRRDTRASRGSTPMHVHQNEDEHFLILEGIARVVRGDETFDAPVGTTVALPRHVPHPWGNATNSTLRMVVTSRPGGVEAILPLIARGGDIDMKDLAAKFGVRVLGPPLLKR
jgi:mannose-6-phosphate isomerase-like protein (cupin superfamily)